MSTRDLLIEIGTEELPPKSLLKLSTAFLEGIKTGIDKTGLKYQEIKPYASPRRLAVLITALDEKQPDKEVERRGPAVNAAFGDDGCPTPAASGFASSCGVQVDDLEKLETPKGAWLVFRSHQKGQSAQSLIPDIITNALDKLPIPKRMRWGNLDAQFVRPVHWAVLLFGDEIINTEILSVKSGRETRGHRFHHPEPIHITSPAEYEVLLESEGKVIADFARRRKTIHAQIEEAANKVNGKAVIDDNLLDEVTSMIEWPVAVLGNFDKRYLDVPAEALVSTMKANQKYFHLVDKNNNLLPHFITISNIESKDINQIKEGNERVIRPRFADAEFFWNQDRKNKLSKKIDSLKTVVFQKQLGTLHDKSKRVITVSAEIAKQLGGNEQQAVRAAELCKCDLMTEMVCEFPELQGIMGRYYASHDGEQSDVATALDDYYKPRFAGDSLPDNPISQSLAIADRIDTLVGIFAIGKQPTGDKDPFALRRAALGVLRIIVEQKLDLNLNQLVALSASTFDKSVKSEKVTNEVLSFIKDRLKVYYTSNQTSPDVFEAVISIGELCPLDIDKRIQAVNTFRNMEESESLAAANKRIGNILKKIDGKLPVDINIKLFEVPEESSLYDTLGNLDDKVSPLLVKGEYEKVLENLAGLRQPVDNYFDNVMVMADDPAQRNNRIALLNKLHKLFLEVADISKLQG
ncbi:MAG: glycine--tRNA ligase subunit beta [Gammaproteobacteria bacterium]|nr:glycine--tRNA ligase subunit beta [Gammaproteobacteria bacterium]